MSSHKPRIQSIPGVIAYQDSTAGCTHWVANFADSRVMGYCEGPLYAQDEDQVLRHPALYHVKTALRTLGLSHMSQREVYLLQNVPCLGELDLEDLYGNQFKRADLDEILSALTVNDAPTLSNIFYIAAPHIPPRLAGKPYQKKHLEDLFYTAYTAFYAAAQSTDPDAECRIHTGNWGAGAFGNSIKVAHLLQIAAAYAAGVDVDFYPLEEDETFDSARELFKSIRKQYPDLSVDQFLNYLTANAQKFELFYGQSNGT